MLRTTSLKLWHYIALAAVVGVLPMTGILLWVISTSVNKDIAFGQQEMRGNAFQRPLEELLDLLPRYQAATRQAAAGDESAQSGRADLQQQLETQFNLLAANYNSELGAALKFTDAELAARKRYNARLSVVLADWQSLKNAPAATAASGETAARLNAAIRIMMAHSGDLSNLILDTDLDSYYMVDITLSTLPQTQQRLGDAVLQVGGWLRAGTIATNRTPLAVLAAMLQQDDQDRITGDAQTALSEDKNFHGISASLQNNLPPAIVQYTEANQAFIGVLNRLAAGENVSVAEFEAAGWNAHAESLRLWKTGAAELDGLLATRVADFRRQQWFGFAGIAGALGLVLVVIGFVVRHLNRLLLRISGEMKEVSHQVAAAAGEVSTASQTLAEGSSEQAASIEETSSSLEEMASVTKRNAENAQRAHDLAREARQAADQGAEDMQAMNRAMEAIKASSDDIAKIIKTIDEIAFQTNILALNAAVEAARAGESGMGFAVVADEVRNLAQRSAQAAKETAAKIEGAIGRTAQGVGISGKVSQTLNEIVAKARQVDELAAEVAGASREQTQGITQINTAVGQMDKVTQSNAASAEESAAAAQELNAQAEMMKRAVRELSCLVNRDQVTEDSAAGELPRQPGRPPADLPMAPAAPGLSASGIIGWHEEQMSTGVPTVDAQHKELINRINDLHAACLLGTAREELMEHLNFLGSYAQKHFAHEEQVMDEHRCPARGRNKEAHVRFLKDYERLVAMVQANGATTKVAIALKRMLADWLTSHICRIDTSLRACHPGGHSAEERSGPTVSRSQIPAAGDFKDF
jgi:hemerythrin-like metal-binding protein